MAGEMDINAKRKLAHTVSAAGLNKYDKDLIGGIIGGGRSWQPEAVTSTTAG